MRLSSLHLPALLLLVPLIGCPPAEDEDKDDTADADTDVDADTDTDTDVDTPAYTFSGSVTVNSTFDGSTVCDADANLTGTPYTGDCPDCEFAVEISDDVTRNDGTEDCTFYPYYTWIEADGFYDLIMASTASYAGTYYDYANSLLFGFGRVYYYYGYSYDYPGPYFSPIAYDGSTTTWSRSGDDVTWTHAYSGSYDDYIATYYEACAGDVPTSESTSAGDGEGGESDLDCKGATSDVWTFTADGGPVTITVDTVASGTAFDPKVWVNGPDECTVEWADDSFDCTYPPPSYQCPAIELETTTAGTYEVVVGSYGSCAGTTGTYALKIDGGTDIALTQDDAVSFETVTRTVTVDVSGTGTLTAAE